MYSNFHACTFWTDSTVPRKSDQSRLAAAVLQEPWLRSWFQRESVDGMCGDRTACWTSSP